MIVQSLPYPSSFDPVSLFGGTGGGMWDPSDMATMWKDTAGTVPVTADGDFVARIDDKSGNGNHLVQATAANRPKFKDVAGLRYLAFDDSGGAASMMAVQFPGVFGTNWSRIAGLHIYDTDPLKFLFCDYGTGSDTIGLETNAPPATIFQQNNISGGPQINFNDAMGPCVITELWKNPGPCTLELDNGGAGSSPSVNAVAVRGIIVGANNGGGAHKRNDFYGAHMLNRSYTAGEVTSLKTWYGVKVGKTL
jgi:hypothetical protein